MSVILWLTAIASVLAVVINIKGHVACFWIWSVTNAIWVWADLKHGLPSQAALQAVYFGLSVWGIRSWGRAQRLEKMRGGHDGHRASS